jgi:uncharacterized membrane protein YhaH (DUF805 family)
MDCWLAVKNCFAIYGIAASGRASRSEFWYLYLFVLVVGMGAAFIDVASDTRVFSSIWVLALLWQNLGIDWRNRIPESDFQ